MYDRSFFKSKVGKASIGCVAAMCLFVALSTQMQIGPSHVSAAMDTAQPGMTAIQLVELA